MVLLRIRGVFRCALTLVHDRDGGSGAPGGNGHYGEHAAVGQRIFHAGSAQGLSVPKKPQQAFVCFKKLEEHDSLTRWDLLGNCYFTGEGTAVNYGEALRCFERGRETSNVKWCQFGRGCLYATPERGYFNPDLAAQNLVPLTEDADYRQVAAKRLVELYAQTQNASQEERWLRVAANARDADAQYNLGVFYFNGKGGRQDLAQAKLYFRQAAPRGQIRLLRLLPRSPPAGVMWPQRCTAPTTARKSGCSAASSTIPWWRAGMAAR